MALGWKKNIIYFLALASLLLKVTHPYRIAQEGRNITKKCRRIVFRFAEKKESKKSLRKNI